MSTPELRNNCLNCITKFAINRITHVDIAFYSPLHNFYPSNSNKRVPLTIRKKYTASQLVLNDKHLPHSNYLYLKQRSTANSFSVMLSGSAECNVEGKRLYFKPHLTIFISSRTQVFSFL